MLGVGIWWFAAGALYLASAILFIARSTGAFPLMPMLQWDFRFFGRMPTAARYALTIASIVAGMFVAGHVLKRSRDLFAAGAVPPGERMAFFTTLALLAGAVLYGRFGDKYVLPFLPVAVLVLVRQAAGTGSARIVAQFAGSLVIGVIAAMWTRGVLAESEAKWQCAETVHKRGVPVSEIAGPWQWTSYYRFQEYVDECGGIVPEKASDFFDRWLPEQDEATRFAISSVPNPPPGTVWEGEDWKEVFSLDYRDALLRKTRLYVVERNRKIRGPDDGHSADFAR